MGKEMAFVFLQHVYAVCGPARVAAVSSVEEELLISRQHRRALWEDTCVEHGRSVASWHRGTHQSGQTSQMQWNGELLHTEQGLKVLRLPIDQLEYVRDFLDKKSREQESQRLTIPRRRGFSS